MLNDWSRFFNKKNYLEIFSLHSFLPIYKKHKLGLFCYVSTKATMTQTLSWK